MFLFIQKLKNTYHLLLSIVANHYFGFPSRKLKVIGVTGTDGKTTTTHLIYHILLTAGKKTSMISSVYASIDRQEYDTGFHVTTPDIFPLQTFLNRSAKGHDEYFVLETTSHALAQNRVFGVKFKVAVLTNVTHEHLDFHKNYQKYVQSKFKLLERAEIAITNSDDQSYPVIKKLSRKSIKTYGFKNSDYSLDLEQKLKIPLTTFNRYNYLAAYAVCRELGISDEIIFRALSSFKLPPGRLHVIETLPFTVIVDFAHTPNALNEVLKNVRKMYLKGNGRLIHLFGSAGKRDQTKRKAMGEASGTYADLTIITEEDYRTEDPMKISKTIADGLESKNFTSCLPKEFGVKSKQYCIVINRKDAVHLAFKIARKKDLIILTGKGHEKSLCRGTVEYPWSDIEAAKNELNQLEL